MESPKKFLPIFDALLIGGLGCGVLGLCLLAGGFVYVWQNPPVPNSAATQVEFSGSPMVSPVVTTPFLDFSTPTISPTIIPSLVPSPVPGSDLGSSPFGKIVFTCFIEQIDQICIMNADGSGRKQLTNLPATAFYASLSPDGQTIYFSSRQTGTYEIYSIDINGNNLQRLTNNIGTLYAPELSPDGSRIIFTSNGNGVWVMNPDGSDPHAITFRDDIDPTWSPDGKRLAFYRGPAGDRDIFTIKIDGTGLERLTNGGDNLGPSWSPDGEWIAFTSFRDGNNEIYKIRPDGTGLTRLTNSTISDWQPRWGR